MLHFPISITIQESSRKLLCCPECARDLLARLNGSDGVAEAELEAIWRLPAHCIGTGEGDASADAP
jgi:hypothetical protein